MNVLEIPDNTDIPLSSCDVPVDETIVLDEGLLIVPTRIYFREGKIVCTTDFEFRMPQKNPHWHPILKSIVEPDDFYVSDEDDESITFESLKWIRTMVFFDKAENAYFVINQVTGIESRFESLNEIRDAYNSGLIVFN